MVKKEYTDVDRNQLEEGFYRIKDDGRGEICYLSQLSDQEFILENCLGDILDEYSDEYLIRKNHDLIRLSEKKVDERLIYSIVKKNAERFFIMRKRGEEARKLLKGVEI